MSFPRRILQYTCYAVIPLTSVIVIVGASWMVAGILEFYSSNSLQTFQITDNIKKDSSLILNGQPDNLFTFVQLSDIHISKFRDYGQIKDLRKFCKSSLIQQINPKVVIVTGDLTDAKDESNRGSSQYPVEWETYISILDFCKQKTPLVKWLDIPGNHDAFKVRSETSNYFLRYSESKESFRETGVHEYIHETSFGSYKFVGVDFTPYPGPGRPFNFFGIPRKVTLDYLNKIVNDKKNSDVNETIWYGHYPLSTTTVPHELRKLFRNSVAYLCGHLHTMLNHLPIMHAVHAEDFLELELGDWKESRRFRVGMFDHDIFSFVDGTYPLDSPLVIFSNPSDARYIIPNKHPVMKALHSTHIRFSVYWVEPISTADVFINKKRIGEANKFGSFFSIDWNPKQYSTNVNHLQVKIMDEKNLTYLKSIEFSLDGTRLPLKFNQVLLLMTDFITIMRAIYVMTVFLTTVVLCLFKYKYRIVGTLYVVINGLFPQFGLFLAHNRLFWALFLYNVFLAFGPFSIGYFLDDRIGIAFPYGIYTDGKFLTGSLTFLYVSLQMTFFNIMSVLYFGECIRDRSTGRYSWKSIIRFISHRSTSKCRIIFFKSIFLLYILYTIKELHMFSVAYGYLAAFCNPLLFGSLLLIIYFHKKL